MPYVTYYSNMRVKQRKENFKKEKDKQLHRKVTKLVDAVNPTANIRVAKTCIELSANISEAIWAFREQDLDTKYHQFKIPKHSGGYRTITAPDLDLKAAQSKIANVIQKSGNNNMPILAHNAAHGFVRFRNTKTALEEHQKNNGRYFLKVDIKDFFPSITKTKLTKVLKTIYPLSTCLPSLIVDLCTICCYNGALPQGSPASPVLSNLYMVPADYEISYLLKKNYNITYTRYADDMLFSSYNPFDYKEVCILIQDVLTKYGLKLNKDKTRYGSSKGSNWNLGLMYNGNLDITVGYRAKRALRHQRHRIETGLKDSLAERLNYNAMLGYYKHIEPEYFKDFTYLTV